MSHSISKAQAEALADKFLDSVGSGNADTDLRPKNTYTELFLLAGELALDATNNLNKLKKNSSGNLAESITVDEPKKTGTVISTNVSMLFYGRFVNKGVKGTRSGSSTAGYSFKDEFPSKKMVAAIQEWIDRAKISTRTVTQYKGYGSHEIKNKSIAELSFAYPLALTIKRKGLEPTGFMDKAIAKTQTKIASRLGAAFKVDVINSIS